MKNINLQTPNTRLKLETSNLKPGGLAAADPEDALQERGCAGVELVLTAFDLVARHPRLTLAGLALFLALFLFLIAP